MLRERLSETLKTALKSREQRTVSTVRLILAAIKDRDIAARGRGNAEGITDQDIYSVLQTMIRQREESIKLYEQGGRLELAQQEAEEIAIIEGFLPKALDAAAADKAIDDVLAEIGAGSLRDMGRAMAVLRERFAGQMDFTKASARVRERLTALG
ncbi:MAG: GatB/YqeY domain-containing protein [Alphaproteobacteria bacterium]|nr:GatB/YqeY domain-containing protein [Alphaproteobacteria bacterium]